jgi:hypothetical protein
VLTTKAQDAGTGLASLVSLEFTRSAPSASQVLGVMMVMMDDGCAHCEKQYP